MIMLINNMWSFKVFSMFSWLIFYVNDILRLGINPIVISYEWNITLRDEGNGLHGTANLWVTYNPLDIWREDEDHGENNEKNPICLDWILLYVL